MGYANIKHIQLFPVLRKRQGPADEHLWNNKGHFLISEFVFMYDKCKKYSACIWFNRVTASKKIYFLSKRRYIISFDLKGFIACPGNYLGKKKKKKPPQIQTDQDMYMHLN